MTIGIGRKFDRRILIFSDTMISDSREDRRKADKADAIPGRLKAIVLNPYVSVAYSGHADPALRAIRHTRTELVSTGNISSAADILIENSADKHVNLEFIFAYHKDGRPFLHKISNGKISTDLDDCFIGDASVVASVLAEEKKMSHLKIEGDKISSAAEIRFTSAFINVFQNLEVNEYVGGFPIVLLGSPLGHMYQGCFLSHSWDRVNLGVGITAEQHKARRAGETAWEWGTVHGPLRGLALLAMALPQAGIGFIYTPLTEIDPIRVRVAVNDGPDFIDSKPLHAALESRMEELSITLGGGVRELEA